MLENFFGHKTVKESAAPLKPIKIEGEEPMSFETPTFRFTETEIADLKASGKTDIEIEAARQTVVNRLARAQHEKDQVDG